MEKLLIIGAEICAFILSILCVYHYCVNNSGGVAILFSIIFAVAAYVCHRIQKDLKFDFKLW